MSSSKLILIRIIALIFLSSYNIKCFLIIPFDTIFIEQKRLNQKDYFTNLTQNELYINFSIGSNEENILAILKMDIYGFLIYEDGYDFNQSNTYETFKPENGDNIQVSWLWNCKQIPSKDDLYLKINNSDENKYETLKANKTLFLKINPEKKRKDYFNEIFYKYAIIGFKFNYNSFYKAPEFIKSLKTLEFTNKTTFYFKFDKILKNNFATNINKGKLIIGKELNDEKTIYSQALTYTASLLWGFEVDHIYLKNNKEAENKKEIKDIEMRAQILVDFPFIKAPRKFFDYIKKQFFEDLLKNNICHRINFTRYEIYLEYELFSFACDSSSNIFMENLKNNFPEIIFEHRKFNEHFILKKNDLFTFNSFDNNDKNLYFLIISGEDTRDWILGIPFLKKYVISYNYDTKMVGYYADFEKEKEIEENDNFVQNTLFQIILIALLLIIILILGSILQKCFKKSRKKKANELDDDFEYESHNDEIDNTINDNKNNNIIEKNNESLGIN